MTVSYKKLWHLLLDKGMTKLELAEKAGISRYAITKMGKDEAVTIFGQKRSESLFWKPSEQPAPLPSPIRMSL